VTPAPGPVFHKFWTPGQDPGPTEEKQNPSGVDSGTPDPRYVYVANKQKNKAHNM